MKRLYARLVLWLIRPALNLRTERQKAAVRYYEAAIGSTGPSWRSLRNTVQTTTGRHRRPVRC